MVKQVRAARTRRALLQAAAEVFAADGYAMASLPSISARAGVSAGALHFHFSSKALLATEVENAAAEVLRSAVERSRSSSATWLETLVDATSGLLVAMAADPVVCAGFRLGSDPSRKNGPGLPGWWRTWVHDLVVQARAAGELADDVSPEGATAVIVAATVGFGALGSREHDWLSPERAGQFWAFVLPRLAASPQQATGAVTGASGAE
ncbi:ScbR family autoregulator-binding transcription factor [Streptomyces brasiliensis]|uniref:TetR family transcriptional regulator n=1 Tax=Streptomyces brasiliensis TaxID=1954 RepID=A0A917NZI8_9ACTN|nr:ScbR family autoregulator-binding transcription factor [Streptomyces brasiliensis]GGJ44490.1 TetR family transcriptional regulator [Streptomyces brasiliensis]